MTDIALAPAPVATHERAALQDAAHPPGMFAAFDLARQHYAAACRQSDDARERAYWRERYNRVGWAKVTAREVLARYTRDCYPKSLRRAILVAALAKYPEWARAVEAGNYTGVVA